MKWPVLKGHPSVKNHSKVKEELHVFYAAIMFYTRIPCPKWSDHSLININKSIGYFPLIGWLVGGIVAIAYLIGNWAISPLFGLVLSFISSLLLTGALHEDGFADVCDGFGGGWTEDKILLIMKDSRVGAYGVLGLILIFLLKLSVLISLSTLIDQTAIALAFISAHSISRFIAATFVFTHKYVRDTADSKAKPVAHQSGKMRLIQSAIFGIMPLLGMSIYMQNYVIIFIIPLLYLVKMLLGRYFTKWIGGYTGDCLGASQQVLELAFYIMQILLLKFTI